MELARELIREVVEEELHLSEMQAHAVLGTILDSSAVTDDEIATLLTAMARREETAAEVTGFVRAMRERMTPLSLTTAERAELVDTCGTGGDGCGTFNISTGAALVAAAAGAKVAKHGNRALTSRCGSADVLEALGVPVDLRPDEAVECLRATGFVFLYAPLAHPAMRRVQSIRRALPFRTIFNLAGPLSNPAGATAQLMGVYAADKVALAAETMAMLGTRHGFVAHGSDGLDELTVTGASKVAEVRGASEVRHSTVIPEALGLPLAAPGALRGGATAAENAAILYSVLRGEKGPRRDAVLLNAAAALVVAGLCGDLRAGLKQSAEAIDSSAAQQTLAELQAFGGTRNKTAVPVSVVGGDRL